MLEWATATKLVSTGKFLHSHRKLIERFYIQGLAKFDLGKTDIVITGHANAGKTILLHQMHGAARELTFVAPNESTKAEVAAVTFPTSSHLVRVLPGQDGFRTKDELKSFLDNPSLKGIIHVTDFGFVHPRDETQSNQLIEVDRLQTVEALRKHNLNLEILALENVLHSIRLARQQNENTAPKWLLIALNKTDLFPQKMNEALAHYHPSGSGKFGKVLKKAQTSFGDSFGIRVAPVCAHPIPFSWNKTNVKTKMQSQQQREVLRDFMASVSNIMDAYK